VSASDRFDADKLAARLADRAARGLLAAALAFQAEARADLSRGNPAPHDRPAPKGDFPRLRTGQGRAAVALETTDRARVARELRVRVGLRESGKHLFFLRQKGWLGLPHTLARCRGRLAALAHKASGGGA
jgi:hypothetical protein